MSEDIIQNTSESVEGEDLMNDIDPPECIEEETWVLIEDPVCAGDSEGYAQLLCQLKSVCIETVEDFAYNPVSVNVHTKRRSVQITNDVCPSTDNETKCGDEGSCDIGSAEVKSTAEEEQLTSEIPDNDNVQSSVRPTRFHVSGNSWNLGFELENGNPLHG